MNHRDRANGAFAIALLGAAAFGILAVSIESHSTAYVDGRVRAMFPKRRRRNTKRIVGSIGPLGTSWVHGSISVALAFLMHRRRGSVPAASVLLCSTLAIGLSTLFEHTLPQRKPPPGRHSPTEPSFPSGHSLKTAATSAMLAYVMSREKLAPGAIAVPLAVWIPVLSGLSRMYLDRHWATDVGGGLLAGVTLAAGCAGIYERARE